ncbi:MAG TPA: hypothetical protein VHT91_14410 [Kofleriaceae bacterium]|jgi:hypothetical protein|nr:hypothetical protein [Kofleriaceae bacterium]
MTIRTLVTIGVGTYLGTIALLGNADTASAAFRRVHSSQCHSQYDNAGTNLFNASSLAVSDPVGLGIYCPAPSDSELPHSATVTLNVHGHAPGPNTAYSEACTKAYNAPAITCDPFSYWAAGDGGAYGLTLMHSWQSDPAGMPFVYSWLPTGSALYGFYMAN